MSGCILALIVATLAALALGCAYIGCAVGRDRRPDPPASRCLSDEAGKLLMIIESGTIRDTSVASGIGRALIRYDGNVLEAGWYRPSLDGLSINLNGYAVSLPDSDMAAIYQAAQARHCDGTSLMFKGSLGSEPA